MKGLAEKTSDNIFAGFGIENPEEWKCKAKLASEIITIISENGWTQKEAATLLGISQVEVSNIKRGHFKRFTIDRLMGYLGKLHVNIQIILTPCEEEHDAQMNVYASV